MLSLNLPAFKRATIHLFASIRLAICGLKVRCTVCVEIHSSISFL